MARNVSNTGIAEMIVASVFAGVAASLLVLDIFWLSTMAKRLYRPELGDMIAEKFRPAPAICFYVIYVIGVTYFAALPALEAASGPKALVDGALLGAVAYSTYDLTNHATLKRWSLKVTLIDIAWGMTLTALATYGGYTAGSLFMK